MQKPKIIFIDLDGTTLDGPGEKFWQKKPTQYTCDVIKKVSKTIPVYASTGRGAKKSTGELVKMFGPETYIAWNGATTVVDGQIVNEEIMPKDVAEALFKEIKKHRCFVVFNSNADKYAFVRNWVYKLFMKFGGKSANYHKDFKNDFGIRKGLVWSLSTKKIQRLGKKWQKQFEGVLEFAFTGEKNNILEITRANVSKGQEEVRFCKMLGINPKDAMHIGDSMNDASAKGRVGTLVALANSTQELKDIADIVTEYPCNKSGLAKFLEQFIEE
ncbi:HAD-IIB family hydrolase [Mycoplasma sp. Pen4]|uniref:HAD-IIB family hydrolase n=1 Tax=Mycoplasma sp. Pen4 TaxID=640330 RepID=UPI00165427D2|nr:HAD-IIB family hydrolase [Mycoplasma sp. Pen4]QNM93688.1 HAD-IIB family hydrolase [Mycoplasma sp. Pen4]